MIMFKECLRNNIVPFIILDDYMRGLKEYDRDHKYLIDTILNAEDTYDEVCNQLLDFKMKE